MTFFSATRRSRDIKTVVSVGRHSEKFNTVSNDHGRPQMCDFCVSIGITNFADRDTPVKINGFRYSFLVCKMPNSYRKISKNFEHFHQAIAVVRLYENKPLQNVFKRI